MKNKIYLFNPINGIKTPTNYKILENLVGRDKETLMCQKSRKQKIKLLNSYIVDDSTSKEDLYKMMDKETIKKEIWKPIESTNESYQISNYGRIKSSVKGKERLLHPYVRKGHWLTVKINGKEKVIHKLVANAFLEVPKGMNVYHKNGNRFDNYANNLGFCTRKELGDKFASLSKGIPVLKIDPDTKEVLDSYENMAVAGKENFLSRETIRQAVKGKLKTAGGFIWNIDKEFYGGKV